MDEWKDQQQVSLEVLGQNGATTVAEMRYQ